MTSRLLLAALACILPSSMVSAAEPPFPLTGTPAGAMPLEGHNSKGFPAPRLIEGQPIETRPPELADDKPAFPGQTRAPFHASAPFNVTVITGRLKQPWSLAFLPDGAMLITEKPGTLRLVDARGTISDPVKNAPAVHYSGR